MRCIDADALTDEIMERYCKECDKRKGIKNGKYRIIYEVGDAPCRACPMDDMKDELDNAPTIEPERKKGKWIWQIWSKYMCSECGHMTNVDECMEKPMYIYCPYCGAKMGEGEKE